MINAQGNIWKLKTHQVLKPVMIPYRYFYDENHSNIPNIFQIRSKRNGSHFTGLRILNRLAEGVDPTSHFYVLKGDEKYLETLENAFIVHKVMEQGHLDGDGKTCSIYSLNYGLLILR